MRLLKNRPKRAISRKAPATRTFPGVVQGHRHRDALFGRGSMLKNGFHGNIVVFQRRRDIGEDAGTVLRLQADIKGGNEILFAAGAGLSVWPREQKGRRVKSAGEIDSSPTTADAVGFSPAPRPSNIRVST